MKTENPKSLNKSREKRWTTCRLKKDKKYDAENRVPGIEKEIERKTVDHLYIEKEEEDAENGEPKRGRRCCRLVKNISSKTMVKNINTCVVDRVCFDKEK